MTRRLCLVAALVLLASPGYAQQPIGNYVWNGSAWVRATPSLITEVTEGVAETFSAVGTYPLTVRRDVPVSSTGATGQNATFNTDANGKLWTIAEEDSSSQLSTDMGVLSGAMSDLVSRLGLDVTHGAVAPATMTGPLQFGFASATAPTNATVATGDTVAAWRLLNGAGVTSLVAGSTLITATSTSLNVNCTGGCSGGTTDTDDASVATGQTIGLSGALSMVYDGSVWRRATVGVAGTASTQVTTVQGIASMTPIRTTLTDGTDTALVDGSGNLNVVCSNCSGSGMVEDQAHANGDLGSVMLARRMNTATSSTSTSGNYGVLNLDSSGKLWVNSELTTAIPTGANTIGNVNAIQSGTWTVQPGNTPNTSPWLVQGNKSNNSTTMAATSGQPVLAFQANASAPSWTETNNVLGSVDLAGNLRVVIPGTVTVGSHAVTNAGTFAVQVTSAPTTAVTVPTDPFGANADAASATGSISAKLRQIAATGIPITGTVTVGSHAVTNAGTFATQVDGAALTALQLIDDTIFQDDTAFTPGTSKVSTIGFIVDDTSTDSVDEGDTGAPRMTLDRIAYAAPAATASAAQAAVGCYIVSAASTNATNCKASAGNFYGLRLVNTTATLYYLRLYNASSAPTCSSATGFIESIPIPASATGAGIASVTTIPIAYTTGIGFCLTGGSSSTDNTNAATGIFGAIYYK